MLRSIRSTFSSGIFRIVLMALMALLILSFGLWGIQDVFRGFGGNDVMRIGDTRLSLTDFQRLYTQEVRTISQRLQRPLSAAEARDSEIGKNLLDRLTIEATLDEESKAYGLNLSSDKIVEFVRRDPAFHNPLGQFDQQSFNQFLAANNHSEGSFIAEQRRRTTRGHLIEALSGETAAPNTLLAALNRYDDETRGIAYVVLPASLAGEISLPDDAALTKFYGERRSDYRAPELRHVSYLHLSADVLAAKITVSDKDAKAYFEANKARYVTPEKRTVQQIPFATPDEANLAAERIKSGSATFEAIAAERQLQPADTDLGAVTRAQIIDPAIAEAAFSLTEGTVSNPVAGKLATVILRVGKIEPQVDPAFETLQAQVKKELALERARKELSDLQVKVDDEYGSGATLKEVAAKFNLEAVEILAIDPLGRDAAGQPYTLPLKEALVRAVFAATPGIEADPVRDRTEGTVWFEVHKISPARELTFEEAKPKVLEAWTSEERAKRLQAKAAAMIAELSSGKSLEEAGRSEGLEVKQAFGLKRNTADQGLSGDAIAQIFATPLNGHATALAADGMERIVFKVTDTQVPAFDPASTEPLQRDTTGQAVRQDLLSAYVKAAQGKFDLEINQTLANRVIGGEN